LQQLQRANFNSEQVGKRQKGKGGLKKKSTKVAGWVNITKERNAIPIHCGHLGKEEGK